MLQNPGTHKLVDPTLSQKQPIRHLCGRNNVLASYISGHQCVQAVQKRLQFSTRKIRTAFQASFVAFSELKWIFHGQRAAGKGRLSSTRPPGYPLAKTYPRKDFSDEMD
jgi:hypothetical protein